jgi:bacterioferritin
MYEKSIELLNTAIADELAAIHQYMYFHFRLDDLGYAPLANLLKMTAIEEMQHAEMIAERILFLGGEVEMKVGREVEKIHDAESMLKKAHALEQEAIQMYNRSPSSARTTPTPAPRNLALLFEDLVAAEEGHWDEFDRQSDHEVQRLAGRALPGGSAVVFIRRRAVRTRQQRRSRR